MKFLLSFIVSLTFIFTLSTCKNRNESRILTANSAQRFNMEGTVSPPPFPSSSPSPSATPAPSYPPTPSPSPTPTPSPEPTPDPTTFDDSDDYYGVLESSSDPDPSPPPAPEPAPPPRPATPRFPELKYCDLPNYINVTKDARITSNRGTLGSLDVEVKVSGRRMSGSYSFTFDIIAKEPIPTIPANLPMPLSGTPTNQKLLARVNFTYTTTSQTLHIEAAATVLKGYHISQLINSIVVRDMFGGNLPQNVSITMVGDNLQVYRYYRTDQGYVEVDALKKVPSLVGLVADDATATTKAHLGGVTSGKINNPSSPEPPCETQCKAGPPKFNNTEPFTPVKEGTSVIYGKQEILNLQQVHDIKAGKARVALKTTSIAGAGLILGPGIVYGQWAIGRQTSPELGNLVGTATGLGISTLLIGKKLTLVTAVGGAFGDQIAKLVEAESRDWRPGKAAGVVCAAATGAIFGPGGALLSAGAYVLADIAKESLPILDAHLKSKELDEFRNSTDYETMVISSMLRNMAPGVATKDEYLAWINQLKAGHRDANNRLDYNAVAQAIAQSERVAKLLNLLSKEILELEATTTINADWLPYLQNMLFKNRRIEFVAQQLVELRRVSANLLGKLPNKEMAKAALEPTVSMIDFVNQSQTRIEALNKFVTDFWSEFLREQNPPTEQTLAFWRNKAIDEKLSLSALFEAMAATELGRTAAINRLFFDLLGRAPLESELQTLLGNAALNSPETIFDHIKNMDEHADNIKNMFKLILGRSPTSSELQEARGIGMGELLMTLIASDERSLIDMFIECQCKMPTPTELDVMLNLLPATRNPLRGSAICKEIGPTTATAKSVFLDTYPQCKIPSEPLAPPPRIVSAAKRMPVETDQCGQLTNGPDSAPCAASTGLLPCTARGFPVLATINGQVKERCIEGIDCDRDAMEATRFRSYSCGTLDGFDTVRQCSLQLVTTSEISLRVPNRLAAYQRQQPRWVWTPYAQCLGTARCYSSNGSIAYCQTNNEVAPECGTPQQASCTKSFRP